MDIQIGDRVKIVTKNGKKTFELPTVVNIKQNDVVLKRSKKKR